MAANSVDYVGITRFRVLSAGGDAAHGVVVAPIAPGQDDRCAGNAVPGVPHQRTDDVRQELGFGRAGDSGETYLVGPDGLMRSDSRLFVNDPQKFKQEVIAAGNAAGHRRAIPSAGRHHAGAAGGVGRHRQRQDGPVRDSGLQGLPRNRTLQSYAPVSEHNSSLQWAIVAKIDTTEAFEREAAFTRTLVLTTVGISFGVCLFAVYLAQLFVRPIKRLETGVQRISAGDYQVAIPVETRDEIGDLTAAFNEMSRSLTVRKICSTSSAGSTTSCSNR